MAQKTNSIWRMLFGISSRIEHTQQRGNKTKIMWHPKLTVYVGCCFGISSRIEHHPTKGKQD